MTWYYIHHCSDSGITYVTSLYSCAISCPHGRAMECLSWRFSWPCFYGSTLYKLWITWLTSAHWCCHTGHQSPPRWWQRPPNRKYSTVSLLHGLYISKLYDKGNFISMNTLVKWGYVIKDTHTHSAFKQHLVFLYWFYHPPNTYTRHVATGPAVVSDAPYSPFGWYHGYIT